MPTVTVRPDSTVMTAGVTIGGGAPSVHAALSDQSDTTYARLAAAGTRSLSLQFPSPVLPAGGRWKTTTATVRCRTNGTAQWAFGYVYSSIDGAHSVDVANQFVTSTLVAPFVSTPAVVASTLGGGMLWSLTGSSAQVGAVDPLDLMDIWIDALYATQPITAVSAPSGTFSDRSIVDVVWSHTPGTDGGAQSRYRVKVFSAAQYGAGGFDAETSTAVVDSGELVGTATSFTTPALDNDSYRAYVKTAQSINGSSHWAEWAFSAFVVDVDTPEILSVVATPQNDSARVRLVVTHDTTTAVDWQTLDVEASYDGGATWQSIYGGQSVTPLGDVWIGYDYEAPNGVTAAYRARASAVVSAQTITGTYRLSNTTSWSDHTVWLKHLSEPARSMNLCLRDLPNDESFARTQGVHAVLGRPGYVVTSDVLHTRTGSFSVLTETTAERDELHELLSDGSPLLLQIPESIGGFENIYLAVGSIARSRAPGAGRSALAYRVHVVPFVEIDRPLLDIAPAGFGGETFADALALGGTFADELSEGGTFEELV